MLSFTRTYRTLVCHALGSVSQGTSWSNAVLRQGFTHSAFLLRQESRLDKTPYDSMTFRRGLLTELLAKALIYTEVEMHWKQVNGCIARVVARMKPTTSP